MGRSSGPPQCVPEPGPGLGFVLGIAGAAPSCASLQRAGHTRPLLLSKEFPL